MPVVSLIEASRCTGISRTQLYRQLRRGDLKAWERGRGPQGERLLELEGLRERCLATQRIRIDTLHWEQRPEIEPEPEPAAAEAHHPLELLDGLEAEADEQMRRTEEYWREWGRWAPNELISEKEAEWMGEQIAAHLIWANPPDEVLVPGVIRELASFLEVADSDVASGARWSRNQFLRRNAQQVMEETADGCEISAADLKQLLADGLVPEELMEEARQVLASFVARPVGEATQ